jgi:2-polyprenyl-3-methyl-5-hydroxy-6-metoxy-1,4-benzoquinol methylase
MSTIGRPATSHAIAQASGLQERYVREWLSAMHTGGVIECFDPSTAAATSENNGELLWHLPAEYVPVLCQSELISLAQMMPQMGCVEDDLVRVFKEGGGVPYDRYGRFQEIMAGISASTVLPNLLSKYVPMIPECHERLLNGINVLDVGCGRGKALIMLAKEYPNSRFFGYDLSVDSMNEAAKESKNLGLQNIEFKIVDLSNFHLESPVASFDVILAFDAIHDQGQPQNVLNGIFRALKPGGNFLMYDIYATGDPRTDKEQVPGSPFLYTVSYFHCMTVSLAQKDGCGLGNMWGCPKAMKMLKLAGFQSVELKRDPQDTNACYVAFKAE